MVEATAQFFLDAPTAIADLGSARIAYRCFGSGPALLLVHGFPLSGFTWRNVLPELSERYTCYAPDLPGMGDTEWTGETDFSFPGQGRTLKRFADFLGLEQYHVIAQDTGGTFARFLALEPGARVKSLALINTEMPHHRPPWIPLYQFLMRSPVSPAALALLLRSKLYCRSRAGFGGCFADPRLIEGDFREHVIEPLIRSPKRRDGMRRYLLGAKWGPVDALAREHARLTMPVRLIWGADDPTFPIGLAREMLQQLPHADLVEIRGARLLVHEEKPAEVVRAAVELFG
jgi:haloalkane dehalogenase